MKLITFRKKSIAGKSHLPVHMAAVILSCFLSITVSWAQSGLTVTGLITDSSSPAQPVAGAAVMVKDSNIGVSSNPDGTYSIEVPSSDAVLVFSFFGLKTEEVPVNGRAIVNVQMQEDAILLDAVVAVGYGTMKKSDLTGSVASIDSELLQNKPISSFDNALRGQIAGVVVNQTDGQPGGGLP